MGIDAVGIARVGTGAVGVGAADGVAEAPPESATNSGFSRGVARRNQHPAPIAPGEIEAPADIGSALPLWRQVVAPGAAIHVPELWTGYIAHFDTDAVLSPIPDEGGEVALSNQVKLRFLPAHYLHSSAAFCVYDPIARVLFSGDIGAALLPAGATRDIWVHDFAAHIQHMAGFHRRYLGSREARDAWIQSVMHLPIDILVPQHGLALRGQDVMRFLDWLSGLSIASGLDAYRRGIASRP